jgi:hypothetical protein
MVFRAPHSTSELAGKVRLAPSGLRRSDPLQWQAKLVLEDEVMVQARLIIRGQRHNQRALGAQLHIDAGGLQKFRRKRRPACLFLGPRVRARVSAKTARNATERTTTNS